MIQVPLRDVQFPQHVRCMVRNRIPQRDTTVMGNQIMDVYTGLLAIRTPREDPLQHHAVESLIPLGVGSGGNRPVQVYRDPGPDPEFPLTEAIAMVTLSSFAFPPQVAGVSNISVDVRPFQFQGQSGTFHFLVLKATVACQETNIHGLAYQVTVLTTPEAQVIPSETPEGQTPQQAKEAEDKAQSEAFDELDSAQRQVDRDHTPESLAS